MNDQHSTSRISAEIDFCDEGQVGEFLSGLLAPCEEPESIGWLGSYRVQKIVGRGGMGVVLKAYDPSLFRVVAIKVVAPQLASNRKARLRLVNEARAAACINHPNVVTIHAIEEAKSFPYIVMEFVPGSTLQERLAKLPPLEYRSLLQVSTQIAQGLAAAHEHGVIHRDIKPGNILLEDGIERVKISDFGLAKLRMELGELTSVGHVVGTPAYLSPEQLSGGIVDYRCDQFSLGCVIYAMAVGHSPFRASNPAAILHNVAHRDPVPLKELRGDIGRPLSDIVERLLQKKPEKRFDSTEDVSVMLASLLVTDYQQTPPVFINQSTVSIAVPPRRWGLKALLAAGVLTLVLLGIVFDWAGIRSRLLALGSGSGREKISRASVAGNNLDEGQSADSVAPQTAQMVSGLPAKAAAEKLLGPQQNEPQQPRSYAGDRRAAEWALAAGGTVTLRTSDNEELKIPEHMPPPQSAFALLEVRFSPTADVAEGLEVLAEAPELSRLYFAHLPLTERSLEAIGRLTELRYLSLQKTELTDAGVEHLTPLSKLEILWLDHTPLTDDGIAKLANLRTLVGLGLGQTHVSDEGLKTLLRLENLRTLTLAETKLTDDGLKLLEPLTKLERLDVMQTAVSDAGIESLLKFQKLKSLNIQGTQISSGGKLRLRESLPKCEIIE